MKKSERLQKIVELNANDETIALKALGEAQRKKQDLEKQLENLQQYRQEYKEKFQSSSESGIKIAKLLEFKAFISKLEMSIDKHHEDVLMKEKEINLLRKAWENKHLKTQNLQKVCDKASHVEHKIEDKREQNEQDDRSTRIGRINGIRNA